MHVAGAKQNKLKYAQTLSTNVRAFPLLVYHILIGYSQGICEKLNGNTIYIWIFSRSKILNLLVTCICDNKTAVSLIINTELYHRSDFF